jgi:hypothetical protein
VPLEDRKGSYLILLDGRIVQTLAVSALGRVQLVTLVHVAAVLVFNVGHRCSLLQCSLLSPLAKHLQTSSTRSPAMLPVPRVRSSEVAIAKQEGSGIALGLVSVVRIG